MAGAFMDININDSLFDAELKKRMDKCDDLSEPFKIIGELGVQSTRENFIAQGRPNAWRPLSQATLYGVIGGSRGMKKRGGLKIGAQRKLANKKILITRGMAGGLMGSVHYIAEKLRVRWGTEKPYGAIQHFGGQAGRGKKVTIPAREWLVVQETDKPGMIDIMKRHFTTA